MNIMDNARFKAYGAMIQSYNYTQEALMDQAAARNDLSAGDTQATASLLVERVRLRISGPVITRGPPNAVPR
jgi:hypothetical protein